MAVANFATAYATLCAGFAGGEGREVVVEEEALVTLVEDVVHEFLIQFCAERTGGEALRFAAGEDARAVRSGQGIYFAPDGADVRGVATVETDAFVEDAAAHSVLFHVVVVLIDEAVLLLEFFGSEFSVGSGVSLLEVLAYGFEGVKACVFFEALLGDVVARLVALGLDLLAEFFVVDLVAIFALHVGAEFLHEFLLKLAHRLDGCVGGLECFEECAFGHFLHFAFHHHDVFLRSTYHEFHIGLFELFEGGVDDKLAVDTRHAHLRDRSVEGDVGASQCCAGSKAGECIGHIYAIGGEEGDIDIYFGVVVAGEEGAQCAVYET